MALPLPPAHTSVEAPGVESTRNTNQCRHSAGTYLNCAAVPAVIAPAGHSQISRPEFIDGLKMILTAVPTDVFEPATVIVPVTLTAPAVILPLKGVSVRPEPALAKVPSEVAFSAIEVLKPLAASTSSDTFARMV